MRHLRLTATMIATGLVAASCAGAAAVTSEESGIDRPTASSRVVLDECFDDATRCGVIHVPQTAGSLDQVAISFSEYGVAGAEPTVLILPIDNSELTDSAAFGDRHVVVLNARSHWMASPGYDCVEWQHLDSQAGEDDFLAATQACVDRLRRAGVDLRGNSRANRASDVVHAFSALGISGPADIIAERGRANTVAELAPLLDINLVAYVHPVFGSSDLLRQRATDVEQAVEAIWSACAQDERCVLAGTVAEFWDDVAGLDAAPIIAEGTNLNPEPRPIDIARFLNRLDDLARASDDAVHLPAVHQAIRDRDSELLEAFVSRSDASLDISGWEQICGYGLSRPADFAGVPAPLRDDSVASIPSIEAICTVVQAGEPEGDLDPYPGLSIVTLVDAWRAVGDEVIIEPTVGHVSGMCGLTAAFAFFDGRLDTSACQTELEFTSRTGDVRTAAQTIDLYGDIITLNVPVGWTDDGLGYWSRNSIPGDAASLDVYVWEADSVEAAREQMIDNWELLDVVRSERTIAGQPVLIASGDSAWQTGVTSVLAMAEVDDSILAVALAVPDNEFDSLLDAVLVPVFTNASIER